MQEFQNAYRKLFLSFSAIPSPLEIVEENTEPPFHTWARWWAAGRGVENGPAGGIQIFPAGGGSTFCPRRREGYCKIAKRALKNALFEGVMEICSK